MSNDISNELQSQVLDSFNKKSTLKIQAGNSKHFYGRNIEAELLDISQHQGIINYEPTELVMTVRAGTTLQEIESTLEQNNQMLAFEPPHFADTATIGGTIACNFSGPRRAYAGAARDFVLGTTIINGKAEKLKFGGEVMKNVAGYDASRLMCGAMGTLGVLLDVSLKIIPKPETEITLLQQCNIHQALENMHRWVKQSIPISASFYDGKNLFVRLSGNEKSINASQSKLNCESHNDSLLFWQNIKEQKNVFLQLINPYGDYL